MLRSVSVITAACFFSILGCLLALYQILCHLRHYTEPVFQRYIIRIIFMVPVYAIGSLCSLRFREHCIYFDTVRDCYEAWIIYNFSSLLLAYVGGPGAVVVKAEGKLVHPSWGHMTCCLPTMQVDGFFLRRCKQGTLQFVLLKPIMAFLTVILYASGAYTEGDMSPDNGYFYISIVYNISYTFALYGLLLFWIGASELLQPFNPVLKFVLVKSVVFLTFWQGIGISYINSLGELTEPGEGEALQNFMICVEMAIAGTGLLFAFPHKEYQMGGSTTAFRLDAFTHAISIRDVVVDVIHVFAPSYSDYVLYTDGGPADHVKRKKYRGQKGGASEHPKAGLLKNMEKGLAGDDEDEPSGRRSKTPNSDRKMEAQRKQAILLDSDSDAMDSDEEGGHLGTEIATDSDDDEIHHHYTRTAPAATRDSVSDGEEQQQSRSVSRRVSRKYRSRNSRSRRSRETADSVPHAANGGEGGAIAVQGDSSDEANGRHSHRPTRPSGIGFGLPLPPPTSRPVAGTIIITAAQLQELLGGPILGDSDDDLDDSSSPLAAEPSLNNMAAGTKPIISDTNATGKTGWQQLVGNTDPDSKDMVAQVPVRTSAAAAAVVKQVSSKAFAAASRVIETAQAAAAALPGGSPRARGAYTAVLPVLDPPGKRADVAKGAAVTVSNGQAASPDWQPAFPGDTGMQQGQRQRGHSRDGAAAPGEWAEQGWSDVKL